MGRLKDSICYLSGPMDNAKDGGVSWRQKITPKLWKMGIGVFNPADKPCTGYIEDFELRERLEKAKQTSDWETAVELTKPIVGIDLRMVHLSSFLVLYIDVNTFMFGTSIEFTWAIQQRKPVLIVCEQGKSHIPNFAFGMNPPSFMFNNFDEMMVYLNYIDLSPTIDEKRRWHFFDYDKVFGRGKYAVC